MIVVAPQQECEGHRSLPAVAKELGIKYSTLHRMVVEREVLGPVDAGKGPGSGSRILLNDHDVEHLRGVVEQIRHHREALAALGVRA